MSMSLLCKQTHLDLQKQLFYLFLVLNVLLVKFCNLIHFVFNQLYALIIVISKDVFLQLDIESAISDSYSNYKDAYIEGN